MNPRSPVLVVAGLGRCGSSLMMQMLQAGGMPCCGEFPAFELCEHHREYPTEWWHQWHGKAVKLLDPHYSPIPNDVHYVTLWMRRDFYQQAKSQLKFALAMMGQDWKGRHGKHDIKKMERQLQREDPIARASLSRFSMEQFLFEDVINNPFVMARKVVQFLTPFDLTHGLDAGAMASACRQRSIGCADGLDMEVELCSIKR